MERFGDDVVVGENFEGMARMVWKVEIQIRRQGGDE